MVEKSKKFEVCSAEYDVVLDKKLCKNRSILKDFQDYSHYLNKFCQDVQEDG